MARGRMINRSAGESRKVQDLYQEAGPDATTFFFLLIAWADVNGNVRADPWWLKGNVCPRIAGIMPEDCRKYAGALTAVGLAVPYEVEGKPYLHLPGFRDEQVGLRLDRESPEVPVPEGFDEKTGTMPDTFRQPAGYLPDTCRKDAGKDPPPARGGARTEVEVEGEVEGEVEELPPSAADAASPPTAEPQQSSGSGGQEGESDENDQEEIPTEAAELFPEVPAAARALVHLARGELRGPVDSLTSSFLYPSEDEALLPDESVKGGSLEERRKWVARALVDMRADGEGRRYNPRALAGFIRKAKQDQAVAAGGGWEDKIE